MTTLTTVVGMLPLAFGIGEGSEVLQPLAVATIGGLSFSTIVSLFVIPDVYLLLHWAKDWIGGKLGKAVRARTTRSEGAKEQKEVQGGATEAMAK
jgi:predicted RND superfamily exporter protein